MQESCTRDSHMRQALEQGTDQVGKLSANLNRFIGQILRFWRHAAFTLAFATT